MSASFQVPQSGDYRQAVAFPDAPAPSTIKDDSWSPMFERRFVTEDDGRALAWLRVPEAPAGDPVLAACALAYVSDDLATDAVRSRRQSDEGVTGRQWDSVSLDHAIWFHHRFAGNEWHLHDFRCVGLENTRGLAVGQVFSPEGVHLATVTQEVLSRRIT
jgi:acyl-CoA thioesterase-2